MSTDSQHILPVATTDLAQARTDFDTHGYCLLANVLSEDEIVAARTRLIEQAEAEIQYNVAYQDGGANQNWGSFVDEVGNVRKDAFTTASGGVNQRVWMLINKGQIFRDLLFKRDVRALIDHALGDQYLLSSYTANIAKPGGVAMDLHTDQWWMPSPVERTSAPVPIGSITRQQSNWLAEKPPELIAPLAAVNVMWMLADFTEENGGTRLVPGSHLSGLRPNMARDGDVATIAATGKAGSAMVFDGRIWHGTGANVSTVNRYGLLTTFCGPMLRTQENFIVGIDPVVLAEASPELLALLGFKIWHAYGRVESPVAEYITREDIGLTEMRPS